MSLKPITELLREKNKQIQQLHKEVDFLVDEHGKLYEKFKECEKDGETYRKEIERLQDIINNTTLNQELQDLQRQVREWRHLAENLSRRIHNGAEYHIFVP